MEQALGGAKGGVIMNYLGFMAAYVAAAVAGAGSLAAVQKAKRNRRKKKKPPKRSQGFSEK